MTIKIYNNFSDHEPTHFFYLEFESPIFDRLIDAYGPGVELDSNWGRAKTQIRYNSEKWFWRDLKDFRIIYLMTEEQATWISIIS